MSKSKNKNTHEGPAMVASIKAAAVALGCSVAQLKDAKARNADGFRANGSVCVSELRSWIEKNGLSAETDEKKLLEIRRLLRQCEKLEHELDVIRGRYISVDQVRSDHIRIGNAQRVELQRIIADAPTWEGLPASEIEKRALALVDTVCANLHNSLNPLYS